MTEFFGSVKNKSGKDYSKSSMINLRSGLNRYLRFLPNNCIINLMQNDVFQHANMVFKGRLRKSKKEGNDVSQPISDISPEDLDKLYKNYFIPGLEEGNTEVLMHKIFFDIMFYTGRRGKEGLCALTKDSLALKLSADGCEYIEITFNKVTKKNQGDNMASGLDSLHNNHAIISEMKSDVRCPMNSFKHYVTNLNPKCNALFQYPDEEKTGYNNKPIGKHPLRSMMSTISNKAKLSKTYTNHCICKTTVTGLHQKGFDLKEIANVTKQKNLQNLENYISGPTHKDKENYSEALSEYAKNDLSSAKKKRQADSPQEGSVPKQPHQNLVQDKENITEENAVIPFEFNLDDSSNNTPLIAQPTGQNGNKCRILTTFFTNVYINVYMYI